MTPHNTFFILSLSFSPPAHLYAVTYTNQCKKATMHIVCSLNQEYMYTSIYITRSAPITAIVFQRKM